MRYRLVETYMVSRPAARGPLLALVVALLVASQVRAAPVTQAVTFSGPEQNLEFVGTADGVVITQGSGSLGGASLVLDPNPQTDVFLITPNPQSAIWHPVSLATDVNGDPAQTEIDFDDVTWDFLDIRNLNLELTGGAELPLTIQPFVIEALLDGTVPINVDLAASGTMHDVKFLQTNPAVLVGDQFTITGVANAQFDLLVTLLGGNIVALDLDDFQTANLPITLNGTLSRTLLPGPAPRDVLVELDAFALLTVPFPVDTVIEFVEPGLAEFSGRADGGMNVDFDFNFHLETILVDAHVPEPATWALFAIGAPAAAWATLTRRRRRRARIGTVAVESTDQH